MQERAKIKKLCSHCFSAAKHGLGLDENVRDIEVLKVKFNEHAFICLYMVKNTNKINLFINSLRFDH